MKNLKDFLNEGISDIVYHYTNLFSAVNILKSDSFRLTAPAGADAMAKGKKGQYFYLSATRSKHGDYTTGNVQGVVFELDGRKLGHTYTGNPIDYWGPDFRAVAPQKHEMEDRIFSAKPTIPNASKYIKSIHVLLPVKPADDGKRGYGFPVNPTPKGSVEADLSDIEKQRARQVWLEAKRRRIPILFYDEQSRWLIQRKPMDLKTAQLALANASKEFPDRNKYHSPVRKSALQPWLELMQKPTTQKVSRGKFPSGYDRMKTLFSIDAERVFYADFANMKTHPDASKIILFMRKNKLRDFKALLSWLQEKWKDIWYG